MGHEEDAGTRADSGVTRREALRVAARLGGALAWAIPVVQTVDLHRAAAAAGSPPPSDGDGGVSTDTGGGAQGGGTLPPEGGPPAGGPTSPPPADGAAPDITSLTLRPRRFHLGKDHLVRFSFFVTSAARVRVEVLRGGRLVRRLQGPGLEAGAAVRLRWDVTDRRGRPVQPGAYTIVAKAIGPDGTKVQRTITLSVIDNR